MNAHKKLTILASCPFCGCAAAYYGAAVRCTSFKCNADLGPNWATKAVRSVQGNPDERLRQAQSETAERWNRRASQAAPAPQPAVQMPRAWLDVMGERTRQMAVEGWTPEHDDKHEDGQIGFAAACYAVAGAQDDGPGAPLPLRWPWHSAWWKPTDRRRDLIKAGALILAEIERLDRTAAPTEGKA